VAFSAGKDIKHLSSLGSHQITANVTEATVTDKELQNADTELKANIKHLSKETKIGMQL
jgi:hypothetical protein